MIRWNMRNAYANACKICALAALIAKIAAYTMLAWFILTNAMLIAKVIACMVFLAIAWPIMKALRCYVAARILLAKLTK